MKMLYPLHSDEHTLLRQGFAEWLEVLGYAAVSVTAMPKLLSEFLHYQETHGKYGVGQLTAGDAVAFTRHQQTRIGIRTHRKNSLFMDSLKRAARSRRT